MPSQFRAKSVRLKYSAEITKRAAHSLLQYGAPCKVDQRAAALTRSVVSSSARRIASADHDQYTPLLVSLGHPWIDVAIGGIPIGDGCTPRGVTAISSASSSIHARILRTSRPFHRDSEGLGIRKMTGNSMARRNKRWRYEYGRIGDCDVGLHSPADDLSPSAAAPVGPHALRAMPRFRQPAPRQV